MFLSFVTLIGFSSRLNFFPNARPNAKPNVMRHYLNMHLFKDINRRFLWSATILMGCLCIVCFLAAWGRDEGTLGNTLIPNLLADAFDVLRLPFHPLLWPIMDLMDGGIKQVSGLLFFSGLFGNCLFYAFVLERVYRFTVNQRRTKTNQSE